MIKRHINKHTLQAERGVVYNFLPFLAPKTVQANEAVVSRRLLYFIS